jgi:excisionase family DNA binding protein
LSQLEKRNVEASDREDSFLTVAEVAETLKLNQQTVRNWIDQGSLPALRVGRRVRIRRSDFDRLLEEGYSGGAGAAPSTATGPSADDFWGGEPVGALAARAREDEGDGRGSAERFGDGGGSAEHPSRPAEPEGG